MARYIDADKLIEHIKDLPTWKEMLGVGWQPTKYPNGMFDCEDIINSIDNQPTADVEEVKRGHWITNPRGFCFCSECLTSGSPYWKRCPICEAKMDGGKEE